ncbi:hypothetical protein NDU88_000035 [Pleurodeles waltl]|uniref:Uncharacterized protein n=1 Tax=Pleurodeles waltl TaxID=8319 RepID=A0AAV7VSA9_PLEWA|nr:hypothetical protein NDU88_000035 [Pleurodeles waltl]
MGDESRYLSGRDTLSSSAVRRGSGRERLGGGGGREMGRAGRELAEAAANIIRLLQTAAHLHPQDTMLLKTQPITQIELPALYVRSTS